MRKYVLTAVLAALVLTACSSSGDDETTDTDTADTKSVSGTFLVPGTSPRSSSGALKGNACRGVDGYDDIEEGMQISLLDDSGKTLAVAELDEGKFRDDGGKNNIQEAACVLSFEFEDFEPITSGFYTVDLGRRGEQKYAADDLVSPIELSIGY